MECNKCHKRGHYVRECSSQMRGGASQRARWPGGGQNYHQQQQQHYHQHKQQQFQQRENDGGYPARGYSNNVGRGYDKIIETSIEEEDTAKEEMGTEDEAETGINQTRGIHTTKVKVQG